MSDNRDDDKMFSFKSFADSHYVFASARGGGLLHKSHDSASKWGSGNSISPCSKLFNVNISGYRARRTVKSSDYGFLHPKLQNCYLR